MASSRIIGSYLSDLPEKLNYYGSEVDFFSDKRARLFPSGKSVKSARETNLTSIFLSNLAAIKSYREVMLAVLNDKSKKVSNKSAQLFVFTEIADRDKIGKKTEKGRPDGLIVLTTGKKQVIEWAAFLEVKVNSELDASQIKRYLEIAKEHEIDLITISDQIVSTPFQTPIKEKINTRKVNLYHWSWIYIRTKAQQVIESAQQVNCDTTFDVDQIYILEEFIRYLDDPNINVGHFTNMGKTWGPSVKELRQLPNGDKAMASLLDAIAESWLHEEQDLCYHLYLKTKLKIYLDMKKKEKSNLEERKTTIIGGLQRKRCINFSLLVPQSVSIQDSLESSKRTKVDVSVCFLTSSIHMSTLFQPNMNQKAVGQTSSFISSLEVEGAGMEDELKIAAQYKWKKKTSPVPLKELQLQKDRKAEYSTVNKEYGDQIQLMEVSQCVELGRTVFASPTKFITRLEASVNNYVSQLFG